ncbi:hypothetical protein N5853_10550 [Bartonella sp. HY329]|uniref:hypothetical protein n=1 Tax=unclassified Bartonella TaxID=2645622 RepID=UPI0021C7B85A|nr:MULTISPECIES: hypothetical protein [unclassified Bartonella]UXM94536.1 hypothetical protein N5853_10550 [Bartonella sp. HY329]UXN08860.1 hypothetical protein N5852_10560 [Bartonella sp. HY328]
MNFLKKLFSIKQMETSELCVVDDIAPDFLQVNENVKFDKTRLLNFRGQYPILIEWGVDALRKFFKEDETAIFNQVLAKFWLLHLRDSLGAGYKLYQGDNIFLISNQDERIIKLTMDFLKSGRERVLKALPGLAASSGDMLAIMIDEGEQYYDYTGKYNTVKSQIILSSGVFINSVLPHFVTNETQLTLVEPTIIHELTHYYLAHLELPLWLDEGLAVNVERVIAKNAPPAEYLVELYEEHLAYWDYRTIHKFWNGMAYNHSTKAKLAYDLGRMMVYHLAKQKNEFKSFVEDSNRYDSGASAAKRHFKMTLGQIVCALLNKPYNPRWDPKE